MEVIDPDLTLDGLRILYERNSESKEARRERLSAPGHAVQKAKAP